MSDANANISISIDTSAALSQLKSLQRQISLFHTSVAKSTTTAARAQQDLQKSLIDDINATGKFAASITKIKTSAESFTDSLEKNKFSMREYFRYAGASTKTFGRLFKSEFDTISKVAEERVKTLQTQYIKLGRDANGALQSIAVRPLALDMQDYGTKTALTAQKQALFNQLMKQGSTNLLNFGKNTQWAGRQLMVGFTIPLTLLGSTASKVFMEMEAQALKFKKVYGDLFTPAAETQRALDDIRELGRVFTRYGVAVSDTMGLAAEAAAAGFQGTDLMRQTREATRLSVLGEIDRQQALKTTIALQNAFGLSSDELSSKINFLNAVENQTVTSLDDITQAIPRVAPVIQQLGGNVEDLAYFITAMKEGGINAAEGANALKSGLSAIINPTDKATAMFEKLNINIQDIVLKNKGDLKGTIQSFASALDDLDPLNRAQALEQLFGRFQLARVSALFKNIAKDGSQASRVLGIASTSMEDLAATADSELGLIEQSASTKFKAAIESLKVSIAPVGEEFLKAVTPIVEFFGNIADKFNNLSDRSKRIITIIVGLVGAIGPVFLMTFGLLANGIANIIKLFLTLRMGFQRITGQSNILSEQTQFLTQAQAEAAAVAHSLDQTHARLIQTFNVEASALGSLATVYERANKAGLNFAARNPGSMTTPVKGFADGIVSVPGPKGAGDIIPAMLSPGESVIPAKQTAKYGGLIQGIVSDNIPGFRKGVTQIGAQFAHITGRQETTMGQILSDLESLPSDIKEARSELIALVRDIVNTFGSELKAFKFSGLGFSQSEELNNAMKNNKPVSAQAFLDDFKSQGTEKWFGTLKYAGTNATAVGDELARYDKALENAVQNIVSLNSDATITSSQFEAIEKEIRKTLPEFSQLRVALDKAESTMTEFRFNAGMQDAINAGLDPYQVASKKDPTKMSGKRRVILKSGKSFRLGGDHGFVNVPGAFDVEQSIQEIKRGAGVASPSKKTIPIGEDIARGLEVGMQNRQDDVARVANGLGDTAAAGTRRGRRGVSTVGNVTPGQPVTTVAAGAPYVPPVAAPLVIRESTLLQESLNDASDSTVDFTETQKKSGQSFKAYDSKLMKASFGLSALSSAGMMFGGTIGDLSQKAFMLSSALFALQQVTQLMTKESFTRILSDRVATASSAMSAAKLGEGMLKGRKGVAGFLPAIGRAGLGLSKFIGPLGVAAGIVTLAGIAFTKYKERQEAAAEALNALSIAATNSKEALDTYANMFGVVPNKLLSETTNPTVARQDFRSQIDKIKSNEDFMKNEEKTIKAWKKLSKEELMSAIISKGLELRARGFAEEQVQAILTALKEETGRTDVVLDFTKIKFTERALKGFRKSAVGLTNDLNISVGAKIQKQIAELEKTYQTQYAPRGATREDFFGPGGDPLNRIDPNRLGTEVSAKLKTTTDILSQNLNSIATLLQQGVIDIKQYDAAWASLDSVISSLNPNVRELATTLMLDKALKKDNPELAKFVKNLGDAGQKTLMLQLVSFGLIDQTQAYATAIERRNTAVKTYGENTVAAIRAEIGLVAVQNQSKDRLNNIKKTYAELAKEFKKYIDLSGDGKDKFDLIKYLKEEIALRDNQVKALKRLAKAGVEAATALDIVNNPDAAKAIANAKNLKEAVLLMEQLTAKAKELELVQSAVKPIGELFKEQLERARNILDYNQYVYDLQFEQELALQERRNVENDYALARIQEQEDAITKYYDDQIKYLDDIQKRQEEINKLQQGRFSLAKALSEGDMSGAASAIQSIRELEAQSQMERKRGILEQRKEQDINNVTYKGRLREEIEFENQKDELRKKEIDMLKTVRQLTTEQMGLTRKEIDNALEGLDLAKNAGVNTNSETYIKNVLRGVVGDAGALKASVKEARETFETYVTKVNNLRESIGLSVLEIEKMVKAAEAYVEAKNKVIAPQPKSELQTGQRTGATLDRFTQKNNPFLPSAPVAGTLRTDTVDYLRDRFGFNSGGKVRGSGTSTSDSIPALLSNGEYVINASSVRKYGVDLFKMLNAKKLASGGGAWEEKMSMTSGKKPWSFSSMPILQKENWEQTANFFGLPQIGRTLQDIRDNGGNPIFSLGITQIKRALGQETASSYTDNLITGLSAAPGAGGVIGKVASKVLLPVKQVAKNIGNKILYAGMKNVPTNTAESVAESFIGNMTDTAISNTGLKASTKKGTKIIPQGMISPGEASQKFVDEVYKRAYINADLEGRNFIMESALGMDAKSPLSGYKPGQKIDNDFTAAYTSIFSDVWNSLTSKKLITMSKDDFLKTVADSGVGPVNSGMKHGRSDLAAGYDYPADEFTKLVNETLFYDVLGLKKGQKVSLFKGNRYAGTATPGKGLNPTAGGYYSINKEMAMGYIGSELHRSGMETLLGRQSSRGYVDPKWGYQGGYKTSANTAREMEGLYRLDLLPEEFPQIAGVGGLLDEMTTLVGNSLASRSKKIMSLQRVLEATKKYNISRSFSLENQPPSKYAEFLTRKSGWLKNKALSRKDSAFPINYVPKEAIFDPNKMPNPDFMGAGLRGSRALEFFPHFKMGGLIKYFAGGGYAKGMDRIPAMLSAGEYVVKKKAVDTIGIDNMDRINRGQLPSNSNSLYNYNLSVNVSNSNANPNDIARTVINQIRQIDAQRIRSNR
jgi:TP901 family phage tail tape measure protein